MNKRVLKIGAGLAMAALLGAACGNDDTAGATNPFVNGGDPAEILANPGEYYVNVHNDDHPSGAIRGQLRTR